MRNFITFWEHFMKPVLFFLASLGLSSFVSANQENGMNEIEREILTVTDQMCGDTWCEGDYDFEFHSVMCSSDYPPAICGFKFDMISNPEYTTSPTFPTIAPWYRAIARRRIANGYNATVRNRVPVFCEIFISAPPPARREDVDDYYDRFIHENLTNCIFDLEDQLAKHPGLPVPARPR